MTCNTRDKCPICYSKDIQQNYWIIPFSEISPVIVNGASTNLYPILDGEATRYHYSICSGCSSIFLDPHQESDDSYKNSQFHVQKMSNNDWVQGYKAQYDQHLKPLIPSTPCNVLDAGCGAGMYIKLMLQDTSLHKDTHFFGLELSEPSIQYINSWGMANRVTAKSGSLEVIDSDTPKMDVIILSEVFEHIVNPYLALCALTAKLTRGGKLWFTAQATEGKLPIRPGEPIYTSRAGLHKIVDDAGLAITNVLLEAGRWKVTTQLR
jgi:SAM-dependent methyltransferase